MIHAPCINTVGGERDTGEKEEEGKKEKKREREKDKPARPIRCLPIKRVATIDFEGESTATFPSTTFYKNKRSDRRHPRRQDSHAYGLRRSTSRQGARIS